MFKHLLLKNKRLVRRLDHEMCYRDSLHKAMKFPIQLAQLFSYFPININGYISNKPTFEWSNWRLAYSFATFVLFVLEFLALLKQQISLDPGKKNMFMINGLVFHIGGLIQFFLIFKITVEWPYIVRRWHQVELDMRHYHCDKSLTKQIKLITISIMTLAAAEHILVNAYKLKRSLEVESTIRGAFTNYFKYASYSYVFEVLDYAFWKGVILQFMNLQRTFNWNFVDVFIMLIGSALTFRLRLLAERLKHLIKMKVSDITAWESIRNDYVKCMQLSTVINKRISWIILGSFSMNLYFILMQLFSSFLQFKNSMQRLYFCISVGLLLLRLICVCFFGGQVYEEWKNIRFVLNSVHTSAYNIEIKRLVNYIATDEIVLSGSYFGITRSLILQIAGAVVSYELVLIQFNLDKVMTHD